MPTFQDDLTISDESELWRRINTEWVVPDENGGGYRISSQAFQNYGEDGAMSVQLAEEMKRHGLSSHDALEGHSGCSLASITASLARRCDQAVVRDPLPNDPAPPFARALIKAIKSLSIR